MSWLGGKQRKWSRKFEFINEWRSGAYSLSELCRQFDISRPTAYKYIKRYQPEGIQGLEEKSRVHQFHPSKILEEIEHRIVFYRKKHPRWGGEKIWKLLFKDFNEECIPSISTVNRVLKRNNLIILKKRRRRVKPFVVVWCVIYLSRRHNGLSLGEIGKKSGCITYSIASNVVRRIENQLASMILLLFIKKGLEIKLK